MKGENYQRCLPVQSENRTRKCILTFNYITAFDKQFCIAVCTSKIRRG
jgi:hypothetical protein